MVFAQVPIPSFNVKIEVPTGAAGKTMRVVSSNNFKPVASTTANGSTWIVPVTVGTYLVQVVGTAQEKIFDVRGSEPDPPGIKASSSDASGKVQLIVTTADMAGGGFGRGRLTAVVCTGHR